MTGSAASAPRRLLAFEVPSEPGNERLALARVAEAVTGRGLTAARLERLKTAVAEAAMNAIEHGNHNQADVPVEVEVLESGTEIVVGISDSGGAAPDAGGEEPDLAGKLEGRQSARGWGLFLIRNMVDGMDVTTEGARHTVWLTMHTAAPAAEGAGQ
jgi:anti-sigma regulatory factor (Ser/Thr protein kinase)